MASAQVDSNNKAERWRRAHLGPLSPDFLRISTPQDVQEQADRQTALALYQQQATTATFMAPNVIGRLSITIAQAKLVRNYGLTRMDPYVRVRVGHFVYETQTDLNGGKNPRWNRVIQTQLASGVNSIYIEIYDECSFKMDELIAWTDIKIPEAVLRGETHEDWHTLSGKQGEGVEGMIDLVLSFAPIGTVPNFTYRSIAPVVMVPNVSGRPMPVFIAQQQPQVAPIPVPPQPISEEDMKQVQEMFPNIDPEVVKSVFEANRGNKNTTINSLLQMTEQ
ncbi:Toll-interacting protein [Pseudolycoriella hygida]|uniref:Toll-interacting protein n=1 Tax=Pseudolycoriella hygida TaxID=35572 RepID=A0A9Q0S7K1_9DIPT|nr:Toll-interacting protein [Pseudolycoriella hygida]